MRPEMKAALGLALLVGVGLVHPFESFGGNRQSGRPRFVVPNEKAPVGVSNSNQNPQKEIETDEGAVISIPADSRQVVFTVLDRDGRLVKGVKSEDFVLSDGGERQSVDVFEEGRDLPVMMALVLDMSAGQESLLSVEKRSVGLFLDSFFRDRRDYGAVLTFQGTTSVSAGLTGNLDRLKSVVGRIERPQHFRDEDGGVPPLGSALFDSIDIAVREVLDGKAARRVTANAAGDGTNRAIRKAVCVLTDGRDTIGQTRLTAAVRTAQSLGVSVYCLGMGDRFRFGDVDREALERLSSRTGGKAFYPKNEAELESAFRFIVDELSTQYVAVYRPTGGSTLSNGFRSVRIEFPNTKWKAVTSDGYFTSSSEPENQP